MARIRSVHPDICVSSTMAELPSTVERTFVRLWTHCDDEGRCIDNPRLIKAALYPLHDDVTADMLDDELNALAEAGKVIRYVAEGKRVLAIRPDSWREYQKPQRPTPSKLPAPPGSATPPRTLAEAAGTDPGSFHAGVGGGEGEGEGDDPSAPDGATSAEYPPDFERFWSVYPRKTEKRRALRAWRSRLRQGVEAEDLIRSATNYGDRCGAAGTDAQFVKHPATFLGPDRLWDEWLNAPRAVNGVVYSDGATEYR